MLLLGCLVIALFIILWTIYYRWVICRPCNIFVHEDSVLNNKLVQLMSNLHYDFCPTFWASNTHLQTIFNVACRPDVPNLFYTSEKFKFPCGGVIVLDWAYYKHNNNNNNNTSRTNMQESPIVCILSGVTGSSVEVEIKHFVNACLQNHFRPVVINYRGVLTELMTERFGLDVSDLCSVFNHIHKKYPSSLMFAAGFSLGSNILLKYLGEVGKDTPLACALSISNPFNLERATVRLRDPICRWTYDKVFTSRRKAMIMKHKHLYEKLEGLDLEKLMRARSSREFDSHLTRLLVGAETVEDLYESLSCIDGLPKIAIPVFLLNALDDPISCHTAIPYMEIESNPNLMLVTTARGGHVAWVEGWLPFGATWMENTCIQYLNSFLKVTHSQ
jgi:predicted alpha/beta-fold hydrolase